MASSLPDYLAAARPVPLDKRAPWYKNVAQTYAGVMLWYVFWRSLAGAGGALGGTLAEGIWPPLLAIVLGGLICHFLFYLVPGLLGMKTGLPLYVVGTSTYGARGGLYMPGFLMGVLQFGWLGVNACMVAEVLCRCFGAGLTAGGDVQVPNVLHAVIAVVFAAGAAFMGLKGIQYVARVASFFPLIPLVILAVLFVSTVVGLRDFSAEQVIQRGEAAKDQAAQIAVAKRAAAADPSTVPFPKPPAVPMPAYDIVLLLTGVVVGFFATAGAAGADLAMNSRNAKDVHLGGLSGVALATIFAGGLSILIVAGTYGLGKVPTSEMKTYLDPLHVMSGVVGDTAAKVMLVLLAISAFPGGCFSAFIAANSFRTTMPKVNPFVSVGIGTLVSILLAVSGLAMKVIPFFEIIGASFGPVCGAMVADYLLSRGKWAGPRAGFNPAGWISWAVGFVVGALNFVLNLLGQFPIVPCPPVAAFAVGFLLYYVLARAGLESKTLEMPQLAEQKA
jgi:cytosine permease